MSLSLHKICAIFMVLIIITQETISDNDFDEFEGMSTLTVEHSIGSGGVWQRRGTITIQSMKSNVATFSQHAPMSSDERQQLKNAVQEKGLYLVRVPTKTSGDNLQYVSSFITACSMYESSLNDQIILSVDQSGGVMGLSLVTSVGYCSGVTVPDSNLSNYNTAVDVHPTVSGPVPDTQSYIQKLEQEKAEKVKGATSDNRSFLAKYWMYIVPLVIFVMVASNADQTAGGGGGR